jgi:hypothetical protein
MFNIAAPLINRIKLKTFFNYIFVIQFYYINLGHLITTFKDYIIKKAKLLIIKDILDKIITFSFYKMDINIKTVFIIAFMGFLYIGEIIYPNRKAKDFNTIRAFYSNIRIAPDGYLIIFI